MTGVAHCSGGRRGLVCHCLLFRLFLLVRHRAAVGISNENEHEWTEKQGATTSQRFEHEIRGRNMKKKSVIEIK